MKKNFIILLAIFIISSTVGKAQASYIVDTGNNSSDGVLINGNYGVAMQFSLGQAYTITSMESMIYNWNDGTLSLAVFSDDTNFPNYADELFRQDIFIPASNPPANVWHGAFGMNLDLEAGPYWATWDSFSNAFQGVIVGGAINPLDRYMYLFLDPQVNPGAYAEIGGEHSTNLTLRIGADEQDPIVPEPATMVLLGSGLIGGAFIRRKRS